MISAHIVYCPVTGDIVVFQSGGSPPVTAQAKFPNYPRQRQTFHNGRCYQIELLRLWPIDMGAAIRKAQFTEAQARAALESLHKNIHRLRVAELPNGRRSFVEKPDNEIALERERIARADLSARYVELSKERQAISEAIAAGVGDIYPPELERINAELADIKAKLR